MSQPVYIVDVFREIVAAVQTAVLAQIQANEAAVHGRSGIQVINYQHGHKIELIETLQQYDQSRDYHDQKYPLIYLVQDFTERRINEPGKYCDAQLNILICHHTVQTLKAGERYAKVFKPVLYPIYAELLKQIALYPGIMQNDEEGILHSKTDRLYWGRQSAGGTDRVKLTDFVDAIEISNLDLTFYFKNC